MKARSPGNSACRPFAAVFDTSDGISEGLLRVARQERQDASESRAIGAMQDAVRLDPIDPGE